MECHLRVKCDILHCPAASSEKDVDGHSDEEFVEWLKTKCAAYYVVREYGKGQKNPHIQAYCLVTGYKDLKSMRTALAKKFGLSGNRAYSISELREPAEHLISYLSKEEDASILAQSISVELMQLAEERIKYMDENPQLKKKPKKDYRSIYAQMMDEVFSQKITSKEVLMQKVIDWYIEHDKIVPNKHKLLEIAVTWGLKMKYIYKDEYIQRIFEYDSDLFH